MLIAIVAPARQLAGPIQEIHHMSTAFPGPDNQQPQNPHAAPQQPTQQPEKKKGGCMKWGAAALGVLIVLGIVGSCGGGDESEESSATSAADTSAPSDSETAVEETTTEQSGQEETTAEEETTTEDAGQTVVSAQGQDWECLPVPEDVMGRILEGESNADGEGVEVQKSAMVQGVDNNFIAADLMFPGESKPFSASFTYPKDGAGPITSASTGTAALFNWPETPGGKLDGSYAAEKCLDEV